MGIAWAAHGQHMGSTALGDGGQNMDRKSRSQIKRDMLALQQLGEQLVSLPADQIRKMALPEELHDAVLLAKRIKKRGAKHRQLQYIGVIMRRIDPEPIRQALEKTARGKRLATGAFRQIEEWRDALAAGDDDLLHVILQRFPGADRQRLGRLVRQARDERKAGKSPRSSRALFRYLQELSEASGRD
ncbi:MAG: DUF615 domain-containing protein [Candidatus Eisenbacteria sp.]|nr:DUF615 domain-containing protein [Candidatus Eisenbacteria bacterium]